MKKLILLTSIVLSSFNAFAQGTQFTYQGRLNDGASPANGSYDLTFSLWNAADGPAQVGGTLTNAATAVSNGLFTVTLDFGNQFPGADRWLEIGVRTNGGGAFTALAPRQALTPTPYAITAGSVTGVIPSGSLSGVYPGAVTLSNPANVVAGTFSGNGAGLSNVNAASLGGLNSSNFWQTAGNAGTAAGVNFLGTTDNQPLELKVNGARALRLEPTSTDSPNVIGGALANSADAGVKGATIGGGGTTNFSGQPSANQVSADFATIGGGSGNRIQPGADHAFVGSGWNNLIQTNAYQSVIGGGQDNNIGNVYAVIGGGYGNTNLSYLATIGGGILNFLGTNSAYSVIGGGYANILESESATIGGGVGNVNKGYAATIAGGWFNTATNNGAFVGGGGLNVALGFNSVVAGGNNNFANAENAVVGGGVHNTNRGLAGTIGGGELNEIRTNADYATIPGGFANRATNYAFAAGRQAKADHQGAFVWADSQAADFQSTTNDQFIIRAANGIGLNTNNTSGAALNVAGTILATTIQSVNITGNGSNVTNVNAATLGGLNAANFWQLGGNNVSAGQFLGSTNNQPVELRVNDTRAYRAVFTAAGEGPNITEGSPANVVAGGSRGAVIGGGGSTAEPNTIAIEANYATIAGGRNNYVGGEFGALGGGYFNYVFGTNGTVAGGYFNLARATSSSIGGGYNNDVRSGEGSTIAGGVQNRIGANIGPDFVDGASIGGGVQNFVETNGIYGVIGGGRNNLLTGPYGTIPGGDRNRASGNYSFAAGRRAKSDHNGTFVWADSQDADFASATTNQFLLRASGGVGINTNNPTAALHVGGIPGTDGIRFPNGTLQTTAPVPVFASGLGLNPTATNQFLASPVVVTVNSSSQRILVTSHKALGSTAAAGANLLNLFIGYRIAGTGGSPTSVGNGTFGNRVAQNTRITMGLSAMITGLAPGNYEVGLMGISSDAANWNYNEYSSTTATVY